MYRLVVLVAVALLQLTGCATVVNGTRQKIGVSSNPPGASVTIDNQINLTTPSAVELARDQSHMFLFKKDGYQDDSFVITSGTSGWVWGNVLLGGLVGGVVDFATGSARKLSHDSVHVTLTPLPAHDTAGSAIVPAIATLPEPNAAPSLETQLTELKILLDKGLISQEEYNLKRAELLKGL